MPAALASRRASGEAKMRSCRLVRRGGRRRAGRRRALRGRGRRLSSVDDAADALAAAAAFGASARGVAAACGVGAFGLGGGALALAFGQQRGDRRVDLDALGAGFHQQLADLALVDRLHLHGGLVGLDLGDDVAGLDLLALLDEPLGELALLHGGRQRGHQDLGRHAVLFVGWVRRSANPTLMLLLGYAAPTQPPSTSSRSASTWPCGGRCALPASRPRRPPARPRDP